MKKGGIGGLLINIGGKSRRVFYSCLPTDISPLIRTGWFHYAFALTFLSLAFFQKRFDTNDFNLIKDIVLSLFHVSPVAPWNLHETIDPTNPSSSFLVKSLDTGKIVLHYVRRNKLPQFSSVPINNVSQSCLYDTE